MFVGSSSGPWGTRGSKNTRRPCGVADEHEPVHFPTSGTGKLEMSRSPDITVRWSRNDAATTIEDLGVVFPHVRSYFWVKPSPLAKPPVNAFAITPLNSLRVMMLMTPAIASDP